MAHRTNKRSNVKTTIGDMQIAPYATRRPFNRKKRPSKYKPHQNKREMERRVKQMEKKNG